MSEPVYQSIIDALRRNAAAEALPAAREAVAQQPDDPMAHRLLAAALRLDGDRDGAIAAIDQAIGLAPEDANLHLERAGLLLAERQLDEAQAALARSVGLDPNQFRAYIAQAQLALDRGDLDETERLARTAARIAPEHPHLAAIEGTLALRRNDADRALALLSGAIERWPEEPQLRHALGAAYLAKGHFAFAEQVFRQLLDKSPDNAPLRALVADVVARQGRPGDAADLLAPLLEDPRAPAATRRLIGEIELRAGRNERALELLREAMAAQPQDRRAIAGAVEAWRRLDRADDARATLDATLATHPQVVDLWRARLAFEEFADDAARAVVQRWLVAMPDAVPALESMSTIEEQAGSREAAEALARRIVELDPGHLRAAARLIDGLVQRGDHDAALARVDDLLGTAATDDVRRNLRHLRARTLDVIGRPAEAVTGWAALHAEVVERQLPLPQPQPAPDAWPPLAPMPEPARGVLLLWGAPGSLVERIAATLHASRAPLCVDRYGPNPPHDFFQRYDAAPQLRDGSLDPQSAVEQWRAALPARRPQVKPEAPVFDWLLWWDNALLLALRPQLPEALLMIALRDPRDMLLDWLAFGAPAPFALASPEAGAQWLAAVLEQVAELHEQDLLPHRLIRLDDIANDPNALGQAVANALGARTAPTPAQALPPRFAPGHWRDYAEPLAEAFATLAPVARRLGYPEN